MKGSTSTTGFGCACQAFVLIALGESIVVIGSTMSRIEHTTAAELAAFGLAFAGSVALWWVYFDQVADISARIVAQSDDPGRLARSAFSWIHPVIVAGIIFAAAADEIVLAHPSEQGRMSTAWLVLGGVALYLGGHAMFKAVVWRMVPWSRLLGVAAAAALLPVAAHVSALVLGTVAFAVIAAVTVADRVQHPVH